MSGNITNNKLTSAYYFFIQMRYKLFASPPAKITIYVQLEHSFIANTMTNYFFVLHYVVTSVTQWRKRE